MNMDHIAKQVLLSYQCCRSSFRTFCIQDPGSREWKGTRSWIWIRNIGLRIYVLLTQRLLLSSWNDVYAGSRILIFLPSRIQGSINTGSRIRIRNTASYSAFWNVSQLTDVVAPFCHWDSLFCTKLWEGGGERSLSLSFNNPQVKNEGLILYSY